MVQCRQGPTDDFFGVACFDIEKRKVTSKIEKTKNMKTSEWIKSVEFKEWIKTSECDPHSCRKPKAMVGQF